MSIRTASIKGLILAATVASAVSLGFGAQAADLEVRIEGLRSTDGDVRVALHRHMEDAKFPGDAGVVGAIVRPSASGTVRVVFADVAPGAYAVAAFHDADGDGELNQNFLGMPAEGYGFSNGAVGFMGPPSFADAAVIVDDEEAAPSVSVPIAYPEGSGQ
ncbi:MAG: DUF2141 domain-containing protein [Rhodospirillaceae bacterium]|nr:DUF2141 domain-containing protein [Rhodospirillaceae bacterium]